MELVARADLRVGRDARARGREPRPAARAAPARAARGRRRRRPRRRIAGRARAPGRSRWLDRLLQPFAGERREGARRRSRRSGAGSPTRASGARPAVMTYMGSRVVLARAAAGARAADAGHLGSPAAPARRCAVRRGRDRLGRAELLARPEGQGAPEGAPARAARRARPDGGVRGGGSRHQREPEARGRGLPRHASDARRASSSSPTSRRARARAPPMRCARSPSAPASPR